MTQDRPALCHCSPRKRQPACGYAGPHDADADERGFCGKLKAARTPAEFLALIDAQEEAQFGEESFTQQAIPQSGYRILAVTACPNGIAHTYMAAEALAKAGDKLGLPTKVETNGSDGAKNVLTRAEIAACGRHHRGCRQECGDRPL